jgi:hypothetical protein
MSAQMGERLTVLALGLGYTTLPNRSKWRFQNKKYPMKSLQPLQKALETGYYFLQ